MNGKNFEVNTFFLKAAPKQPSYHARVQPALVLHQPLPLQPFIGLSSSPLLTTNDFLLGSITRTVVLARICWHEISL